MNTGQPRELTLPGRTRSRMLDSFTIPEAAAALGRSEPNFRRWLARELIPQPALLDASRGYLCYSLSELEIIAEELREHERTFQNLCETHTETIVRISQRIHGHRDVEYGITRRTR